ncbi:aldo/keto reductase [Streptomyces sp. NPDC015127]|uniref:aldo/keto reductase n=1 Tax=Streptomyces sp. NPDC015127 TaxID=3364939 RepID=UPI0036FE627E
MPTNEPTPTTATPATPTAATATASTAATRTPITAATPTPSTDRPAHAAGAGRFSLGGDLPVARMGFGAMRLPAPDWHGPAGDPDRAVDVLRRAVGLGVDHIDTAWFYFFRDLSANALIRRALHPYPDDLVIATKVGPGRTYDGDWLPSAGPAELTAAVHRTLRELGRDHLDLVYLRALPSDGPLSERFGTLAELRDQGLIRHLGVSNMSAEQLAEARRIAPVSAVQNHFSLTHRKSDDVLDVCAHDGIAFVPFFPLGGLGALDLATLRSIADRHAATPAQVMLAGLLALSPVMLPIPGTSSPAHLEENIAATALRLTPEDLTALTTGLPTT